MHYQENKKDICKMTNEQIKRCAISQAIREMQIKASVRYHDTPVRMSKVQNTNNAKCRQERGTTGTLETCC